LQPLHDASHCAYIPETVHIDRDTICVQKVKPSTLFKFAQLCVGEAVGAIVGDVVIGDSVADAAAIQPEHVNKQDGRRISSEHLPSSFSRSQDAGLNTSGNTFGASQDTTGKAGVGAGVGCAQREQVNSQVEKTAATLHSERSVIWLQLASVSVKVEQAIGDNVGLMVGLMVGLVGDRVGAVTVGDTVGEFDVGENVV